MLLCKDCRCYHPVQVSDRYCGECCIGETRNPIAINEDINACCLYEPKQPKQTKKLTNADRIRQMTDEELTEMLDIYDVEEVCEYCVYHGDFACHNRCYAGILAWLKQEAKDDAET